MRLQPRALRLRWPPIPGGRGLTYTIYHIARCEILSQTYPLRSEACFLLECGVRSTITPSQEAHADFYAPACVTPPHQVRLRACYFTHSPYNNCHGSPVHRQTFFFFRYFILFYKYTFRSIAGRDIHLHPPSTPFLTIDVCSNVCTSDSALFVRAGYRRHSFGVTPYQSCCPHRDLLINAARSLPITSASVHHPTPLRTDPGQPQLSNESRPGCLVD